MGNNLFQVNEWKHDNGEMYSSLVSDDSDSGIQNIFALENKNSLV